MEQLAVLHALTLAREAQCLERDVQSDFVPELETIHHGSRGVVDPQRHAADTMRLEAFAESLGVKAVHRDGYRQLDAVVAAPRDGQVDRGWNLSRDAVIGEGAYQANRGIRRTRRHDCKVWVFGLGGVRQAVQAASQLDELATLTKGVQRIGMNSERDQVAGTEGPAVLAEGVECGIEISGLHAG